MPKGFRSSQRKAIRWPSHARSEGVFLVNHVAHDLSRQGLFLEADNETRVPSVGAPIRVTLFHRGMGQGYGTSGRVAWVGYSDRHHCRGVGITLDAPLPPAAWDHLSRETLVG